METKVQMTTSLKHKWSSRACLPIVGEVEIDSHGKFEVNSQEEAKTLQAMNIGFNLEENPNENPNENPKNLEEDLKKEDLKKELNTLSTVKLKEYCKDFPSVEWRNLKKEQLIEYIFEKIYQ